MRETPNPHRLGELEQQVMTYLWGHGGPRTGEEVRAAVNALDGRRALTDSTIRTVLRRLEVKGFVRHEVEGRQFRFYPATEPSRVAADTVRGLLQNICQGSLEELLLGLVDHRVIDSTELKRIAQKIEARKKPREKDEKSGRSGK